jgi:hypothetical protein
VSKRISSDEPLSPFSISCDAEKAKEIRKFEFQNLRPSAKSADKPAFPASGAHSELTRPANKKSRAWIFDPGTAPRMRDLQLSAVPYALFF